MTLHAQRMMTLPEPHPVGGALIPYLGLMALIERLQHLLLDLIKDEFERLSLLDVNPVQALILFHIADHEVTAGELRSRGFYQGSNVSYNLKKLVELGYLHHARCAVDRRSVRIRLTEKGHDLRHVLTALFARQAAGLTKAGSLADPGVLDRVAADLGGLERYWADQIRYIY
ncbi:MarR family winged helix-turn-helix transcriptional regulator [Paracoccus sp. p4-l81]|uniref:MarR family winged helix-turn-helix transcriptional regulator n=1 Tax=unclassified Paracoccus (in: a-proteobacteria) TaxID=2688777 RepID=UPI0035B9EE41